MLDVDCAFRCHVRRYAKAKGRFVVENFRVVAVRDRKRGTYNAPSDMLPAECVAATYRLWWEASLLRATASMQALARFRRVVAEPHGMLVNPGQWVKWWNRQLLRVAERLVEPVAELLLEDLARMLADPYVRRITNRERFRIVAYAA